MLFGNKKVVTVTDLNKNQTFWIRPLFDEEFECFIGENRVDVFTGEGKNIDFLKTRFVKDSELESFLSSFVAEDIL